MAGTGLGLTLVTTCPAFALNAPGADQEEPSPPAVQADAGDRTVSVTVRGVGSTVEGRSFSVERAASVSPACWYGRGMSGQEYYEYWRSGGEARRSSTLDNYAYQDLLYPDYEDYATETEGYWYSPQCAFAVSEEVQTEYLAANPPVFWMPGDEVPSAVSEVDPEQLALIAFEATELPAGVIEWNPRTAGVGATLVNVETWVWAEGAAQEVSVRASIESGTWAQVDAVLDRVELSAPGADPVTCAEPGVAWAPGVRSTPCSIEFWRSSATQPVKEGQSVPTSTLTVTAVWTASWVSSVDATPTDLPTQQVTTEAEVPVGEIQALVTHRN